MSTYVRHISHREKPLGGELRRLDIELTERCNNNCIHCCINLPVNDKRALKDEMSLEEIKNILTQAADLGCLKVRLTGGEPLLRPDFQTIYTHSRRLGMRVLLFTNARLITPGLAQLFSRIPPLEVIQVTVYGMHEDSYNANTQQTNAFQSFWRGVQLLMDYNIPFIVKSVFLPANEDELDELKIWAKTIPRMDKQPGITMFYDLRNRLDDPVKNQVIKSLRPAPNEGMKYLFNYHGDFNTIKSHYCKSMTRLPGVRLFGCKAGKKQLSIDAYGRIQACLGLRSPGLVLARGTHHRDALKFFRGLKEIEATNPEYLERCANCFLRNLCEQCPGKAWTETRTLDTPIEYLCDVTHALARELGWLDESEKAWKVTNWKDRIICDLSVQHDDLSHTTA